MIILKRCLWLAAWSVWLWFGLGFARELPRKLDVVCKLPFDQGVYLIGFLQKTNHFAVLRDTDKWVTAVSVFDAETGELVRETKAPPFTSFAWLPDEVDDPAFLYANARESTSPGAERGLRELNVATGEWRKLCDERYTMLGVDPRRKVALCVKPRVAPSSFTFLDLQTGKPILVRDIQEGWGYIPWAQVSRELGVAVLPTAIWPKRAPRGKAVKLEVWRLGPPVTLESTIDVTGHRGLMPTTAGGLLALPRDGRLSALDVYDLKQSRWVYRGSDEAGVPPTPKHYDNGWMLSRSGRTASNGLGIWDLATGRRIWRASPHEFASPTLDGRIHIAEQWSDYWKKWLPNHSFETSAWRDMDSGELLYRTTIPHASDPQKLNASRTLAVAFDGTVYRLPPRINWLLLALCQTLLALPLALLWAMLNYRQRQAARRQSAVAPASPVTP